MARAGPGAMSIKVDPKQLALVRGLDDTRRALAAWQERPLAVLGPWLVGAVAIALALLGAVAAVAAASPPDPTRYAIPGLNVRADLGDYVHILIRNTLVLALHALACVAGFIAGSSLPLQAQYLSGFNRLVHERAGPLAMAFVAAATLFSLATQAYVLGGTASTLAAQLGVGLGGLLLSLLPHALPELTAVFLPLAAWLLLSREGRWNELLAATAVCVAVALPVLFATAAIELTVWPRLLAKLAWG